MAACCSLLLSAACCCVLPCLPLSLRCPPDCLYARLCPCKGHCLDAHAASCLPAPPGPRCAPVGCATRDSFMVRLWRDRLRSGGGPFVPAGRRRGPRVGVLRGSVALAQALTPGSPALYRARWPRCQPYARPMLTLPPPLALSGELCGVGLKMRRCTRLLLLLSCPAWACLLAFKSLQTSSRRPGPVPGRAWLRWWKLPLV